MKKQAKRPQIFEESIEAKNSNFTSDFKDLGSSLTKSFWEDLLGAFPKDAAEQISGKTSKDEELSEGEAVVLRKTQKVERTQLEVLKTSQHNREYFRKLENRETTKTEIDYQVESQVERLRFEIKQLIKASKELQISFKEVSKDENIVNPGKYHLNFFEWVLSVVQNARIRVEEGANWMHLFASKKKQKRYWNMAKKQGTSFTLNNERTSATQAG